MVFSVVMHECESWTIKKVEYWIDAFELWCWRWLLRVPWTARRSNQSILKEISPGISYDAKGWNSSTLTTSCEELTHWKRLWCWEGLGAGGEGNDRVWDGWMASPTQFTWVWVNSGSWWRTRTPGMLWFMGSQRVGHDWATELTEFWDKYLAALRKHTHETPVSREGQGSVAHCSPWGCKASDLTEHLKDDNEKHTQGFLGSSGWDSALPMQGAWVWSHVL